jgi:hypothetical protein
MQTSFWTLRIILLLFVGGFTVWSGEDRAQAGPDSTNAIPPKYRELIARYILTVGVEERYLRTAMIAKPFNKPDGILGRLTGTTVPVVCVSGDTRNMLGMEYKGYFAFYFENGRLRRWNTGSAILASECGAFSPFPEVMKR